MTSCNHDVKENEVSQVFYMHNSNLMAIHSSHLVVHQRGLDNSPHNNQWVKVNSHNIIIIIIVTHVV